MHRRIAVDLVKSVHLVAENVRADVVRQHRRAGPSTAAIASPCGPRWQRTTATPSSKQRIGVRPHYTQLRCRDLAKNSVRLMTRFALSNL